jgi:hypothetical protein
MLLRGRQSNSRRFLKRLVATKLYLLGTRPVGPDDHAIASMSRDSYALDACRGVCSRLTMRRILRKRSETQVGYRVVTADPIDMVNTKPDVIIITMDIEPSKPMSMEFAVPSKVDFSIPRWLIDPPGGLVRHTEVAWIHPNEVPGRRVIIEPVAHYFLGRKRVCLRHRSIGLTMGQEHNHSTVTL